MSDPSEFMNAVEWGDLETCVRIYDGARDTSPLHKDVDHEGNTALILAASRSRQEVCEFLISKKFDVSAKNLFGDTALHCAARIGNDAICAALLTSADTVVNARNNRGKTPLFISCDNLKFSTSALLIEKGADVNAMDIHGNTPLHRASSWCDKRLCTLLVENGADVNARTNYGCMPLHHAVWGKNAAICNLLVKKGADVNVPMLCTKDKLAWIIGSRLGDYVDALAGKYV